MTQQHVEKQKDEVFKIESTVTLDAASVEGKDKFNPFGHRNIAHPTSTLGSFFHLLKSSLGSGLLAMPAAFKHAGIIPGCIGTVLVAVIATHCVHILEFRCFKKSSPKMASLNAHMAYAGSTI